MAQRRPNHKLNWWLSQVNYIANFHILPALLYYLNGCKLGIAVLNSLYHLLAAPVRRRERCGEVFRGYLSI